MVSWIIPPVGLIEPAPAPEFFITSVGAIELIGECIRVYYCIDQLPLEAGSAMAQTVVALKIVRPVCSIPAAISRLAQCLISERSPDIQTGPFRPRVVR